MLHLFDRHGPAADRLTQPRRSFERALAPGERVVVFIDDPNVSRACTKLHGHGVVHPVLLAQRLVGAGQLAGIHFYADTPDRSAFPDRAAMVARRNGAIATLGVTVVERPLRYVYEWEIVDDDVPDPRDHGGERRLVAARCRRRGREKGLDLALALDVQALASEGAMDVDIVSGDTDFCEVASRVPDATQGAVAVEAALFTASGRGRCLEAFGRTHRLGPEDFAAVRDDFDYRRPVDPALLAARIASAIPRQTQPLRPAVGGGI